MRRLILLIKKFIAKKKIAKEYDNKIIKNGWQIFHKEKEIYDQCLIANRSRDTIRENYLKGQLDIIKWLTGKSE